MKYANFLKRGVSCRAPLNTSGMQKVLFRRYHLTNLYPKESYAGMMRGRLFTSGSGRQDIPDRGMEGQNESSKSGGINESNRKNGYKEHNENSEHGEHGEHNKNGEHNEHMNRADNTGNSTGERQNEEAERINYEKLNKVDLINEIKKVKKNMEEKIVDNKILKEKYLSVLAENENLRNRYIKEIENSKLYCISNFAKSLLDVADNLSLAIKNISEESLKQNEEIHNIYKGIQMTETILHNIFNKYGIDKYDPINEKFNPQFHEALFEIDDTTKEKGTVATVVQQGYKIKDRILRAAKVGVVKN
ncbi:GrpE protein homolog, mitochondrial [Plasmodium gonderi]|uniref:GrpE protein homolog n=1 Tax=Plasmodium gonderi TaxID=77519 RepID=A0A1Y1JI34_PLAGO|nr:GrpE protein homolog, mitochondrial [Plasmodium gonderi]GAW81015.1 GrpE protein homolog, mitochondrial [Plasmodium gonderi]